jgi:ribosomal protein S27E
MAERAGEEFDGRYDREPLQTPCPECGDFDCVYWVDVDRLAKCQSCGADLEEIFYTGGLYDPPVSGAECA